MPCGLMVKNAGSEATEPSQSLVWATSGLHIIQVKILMTIAQIGLAGDEFNILEGH